MTYVSELSYVWYYVVVKSGFKHALRNVCPRGPMCLVCHDPASCYCYFV